jgi:hypothetical protein
MKTIIIAAFLVLTSAPIFADSILLNKQQCDETKIGIGEVLGVADYLFKEIEKNNKAQQSEEERQSNEDELYLGAIAFSQIAANYSTVYDVWCKD